MIKSESPKIPPGYVLYWWYNCGCTQTSAQRPNYDTWLNQIVAGYQTILDGKDRTFARFLLDLPAVPADVLDLLRDLCVDSLSSDRMQVGYTTLRGLTIQRPSMRADALNVLLELTTHPGKSPYRTLGRDLLMSPAERRTRAAAINTVKVWAHTPPLDDLIRDFALAMLRKLETAPTESMTSSRPKPAPSEDVEMANGDAPSLKEDGAGYESTAHSEPANQDLPELPNGNEAGGHSSLPPEEEELVQTPYLPDRIELPADKSQVLQHLELMFALSVKVPEFLEK